MLLDKLRTVKKKFTHEELNDLKDGDKVEAERLFQRKIAQIRDGQMETIDHTGHEDFPAANVVEF